MRIRHHFTVQIPKGKLTVLVVEEGKERTGLTVLHDGKGQRTFADELPNIEKAIDRQKVTQRTEIINREIAEAIEIPLIEWLSHEKQVEYRYLRWDGDEMAGFDTREAVEAYDQREDIKAISEAPKKKRIMLG